MRKLNPAKSIAVRTHVGRDLLQSAAMFKTDKLVVWEYVANGLQYREPGVPPVVNVTLDSRSRHIVVDDNGCGMDRDGLQRFFVMHGENADRKSGRAGRGRFGTGKSAAFGVANSLRVSSILRGNRNTVELCKEDIEAAGEGEIKVRTIERDVPTDQPNGTVVTISELNLRKLDPIGVIKYIERHLAHWPGKPLVLVNGHACEYSEPPVSRILKLKPTDEQRELLGDVELLLKVAKSPLEPELQGVAIYANGVWLETTLAGAAGQAMAQYIFGSIDVPALDDDRSAIPAFDMSRSMQLNPSNDVVQRVLAFVGFEVDRLRRELAKEERTRRAQEEMKKLTREAGKIAEMINRDFNDFSDRLARVKARSGIGHDLGRAVSQKEGNPDSASAADELVPGGALPAGEESPSGNAGRGNGKSKGGAEPPYRAPLLRRDANGRQLGQPRGIDGNSKQHCGGFTVEFKDMGEENPRASYVPSERTIYVNLDHPQIQAAKGSASTDDPVFRRLAYEVAFSEYAIALAIEMDNNGEFIEPSDATVAIRETLNRMARRAASLYAT